MGSSLPRRLRHTDEQRESGAGSAPTPAEPIGEHHSSHNACAAELRPFHMRREQRRTSVITVMSSLMPIFTTLYCPGCGTVRDSVSHLRVVDYTMGPSMPIYACDDNLAIRILVILGLLGLPFPHCPSRFGHIDLRKIV